MKNLKDILESKFPQNKILEKLIITKDTKEKPSNIFWFTNNFGIKLPFTLQLRAHHTININIVKIEEIQKDNEKIVWATYDDQDRHVINLYHSFVSKISTPDLLFKSSKHMCVGNVYDQDILKELGQNFSLPQLGSIAIRYKDNESKILKESIQESQDEPKRYSNMILLNPDEDAILVLRRANYMRKFRGMYGFPGGSVDPKDKNSKNAAVRELKEETGIELTFNEERKCQKFDSIKNEDGSISDYYLATLEAMPEIKLSREHTGYEWFNEKSKKNHKWMPDVFQLIQKIL